jgi:molybdopterin-guanine dinucleotide biosynthesis protein A
MPGDRQPGPRPFSAVVLAAGFSRRMGRDKALLLAPDDGAPLWDRQRRVLAEAGAAEIFLSARDGQRWANAAAEKFAGVVHDAESDAGPLAGILAAFDRALCPRLVVLAVDLPHMTPAYLKKLVAAADLRGAVPAWPDGRSEPLCAVYPREAMAAAAQALERQQLAVRDWVDALARENLVARVAIDPADASLFLNWNEPGDLPRA